MLFRKRLLGEILVDRGIIGVEGLNLALERQRSAEMLEWGRWRKLGEVLLEEKLVTEKQIQEAMEIQAEEARKVVTVQELEGIPILKGLKKEEFELLATCCRKEYYKKDEVIFSQGDKADELYAVLDGKADVLIKMRGIKEPASIHTLKPNEVFGELAFIDRAPRSATIKCVHRSDVVVLKKSDFNSMVKVSPHIEAVVIKNIATILSRRMRDTDAKLKRYIAKSKKVDK